MIKTLVLSVCFLFYTISFAGVQTNPVDEESLNALPQAIRQSPSPLVQVLNGSSVDLEENTMVNVTNTSLADIENDNLTHSLQLRYRERKKQERIIVIQAQILHRLRMDVQPNISSAIFSDDERKKFTSFFERMHNGNNGYIEMAAQGLSDPFFAKLQSFYPSCSLPNITDRPLWDLSETFRIYYDTPFNKQSSNSDITNMLAKLRLYKITGNSDPNFIGWNPSQNSMSRYNELESLINSRAANGINVSIYQFMKPLRANKREKKRLVDSRTISIDHEGWVEFNVLDSLNYWLHHPHKNYGFDVMVEDAYGNKLNPNLYFQNINCSGENVVQDPPFPNIMELHPDMGENESSLFDNETYPTLDLQTAELPREFSEMDALTRRLNERVIRRRSNRHNGENSCHGVEEYVTFAEMGLDNYILWPPGLMWTFCEGSCGSILDRTQRKNSFYSTWMERLFRIKPKETASTCVATRSESLPVVLNDGDNDNFETILENIVPTSCGCRST